MDTNPPEEVPAHQEAEVLLSDFKRKPMQNRFIITGVRWAESVKRKNSRGVFENYTDDIRKRTILNNDNEEGRAVCLKAAQSRERRIV
mgnify:CR=1 FL=1